MKILVTLLIAAVAATGSLQASLKGSGHSPKINVHWPYVVRVAINGKPAPARITAQIVDPTGGVHLVEFGRKTKKIANWPFKGVFSDYVIWPPEARGIPLTFRVTVRVGTVKKVIGYTVTPRA
jgi:hypothetical protein